MNMSIMLPFQKSKVSTDHIYTHTGSTPSPSPHPQKPANLHQPILNPPPSTCHAPKKQRIASHAVAKRKKYERRKQARQAKKQQDSNCISNKVSELLIQSIPFTPFLGEQEGNFPSVEKKKSNVLCRPLPSSISKIIKKGTNSMPPVFHHPLSEEEKLKEANKRTGQNATLGWASQDKSC